MTDVEVVNTLDSDPPIAQEHEQSRGKKRQTTSSIWNDFTKIRVDGVPKAKCNHCKKVYLNRSKDGTSHLRAHLKAQHPAKGSKDLQQSY